MLEGTLKSIWFQTLCQEQECLPSEEVTQSPIQPYFEHFKSVAPPASMVSLGTKKELFILLSIDLMASFTGILYIWM